MLTSIPADRLCGVVSVQGSGSSHVAILARAMGIPAVMGAVDLPGYDPEGVPLIVDGHYGESIPIQAKSDWRKTVRKLLKAKLFEEELEELKDLPCITQDGWRVQLWVNIGLSGDITRSLDRGAEGIGLFRTEVPFMTKDRFPTEVEQRAIYREHMEAFEPRPVTMRSLDIGGDKALSYFPNQRRKSVFRLARYTRHLGSPGNFSDSDSRHAQSQCRPAWRVAHYAAHDLQPYRAASGSAVSGPSL